MNVVPFSRAWLAWRLRPGPRASGLDSITGSGAVQALRANPIQYALGGTAQAGTYYDPTNTASNSGKTTGFELYKTIGCLGRGLLDPPCPGDVAAAPVAKPAPAPAPAAKPADSDGDGVTDDKDRCPDTPKGAKVNADGCELDSDGDGVMDALDQCQGTPAGSKVDSRGCTLSGIIILKGVNFDNDLSELRPDAVAILDQAVATLQANPGVKVEIGGHTDSRNSDWYNLGLGERRAKAVMQYFISKGVAADRLSAKSYGESMPIADNETEEGRMQNRRVELKILD